MLTVYLHEIQTQMRSMRFQVSLLVLLLFFVANGVIYALKIERDVAEISRIDSEFAEKISEVSELNGAIGRWYRLTARSTGTEFITEGAQTGSLTRIGSMPSLEIGRRSMVAHARRITGSEGSRSSTGR